MSYLAFRVSQTTLYHIARDPNAPFNLSRFLFDLHIPLHATYQFTPSGGNCPITELPTYKTVTTIRIASSSADKNYGIYCRNITVIPSTFSHTHLDPPINERNPGVEETKEPSPQENPDHFSPPQNYLPNQIATHTSSSPCTASKGHEATKAVTEKLYAVQFRHDDADDYHDLVNMLALLGLQSGSDIPIEQDFGIHHTLIYSRPLTNYPVNAQLPQPYTHRPFQLIELERVRPHLSETEILYPLLLTNEHLIPQLDYILIQQQISLLILRLDGVEQAANVNTATLNATAQTVHTLRDNSNTLTTTIAQMRKEQDPTHLFNHLTTHNPLDLLGINHDNPDLTVGTYNVNGAFTPQKLGTIIAFQKSHKIDVLILQDTRITAEQSPYVSRQATQLLGTGSFAISHGIQPQPKPRTVQGTTRIGAHCTRTHHGQHTAAAGHSILLRQLLPQLHQPTPTFLIYREPTQPHHGTIYHITHKQITHHPIHQPHQPPIPNWIHQVTSIQPPPSDTFPIFQPIDLRRTEAFTDGSYATTNHDVHSIFYTRPQNDPYPPTTLATASIILSPTGPKPWATHRLIGIRITNGTDIEATSAYPMEAIAIAATLQLYAHLQHPNGRITTDCLSLQKRIQHLRHTQKNSSTAYHTILHAATHYAATTPTTIHWQKAHPENDQPNPEDWTRAQTLNHLADALADDTLHDSPITHKTLFIITVTAAEVLAGLILPGQWHITTPNGSPTSLNGITHTSQTHNHQQYLTTRDQYRLEQLTPRPQQWITQTPQFAAKQFSIAKAQLSTAASHTRLIYDKGWHNGNAAKGSKTPEQHQELSQCPLCQATDSQRHWLNECQHPNMVATRKEHIKNARTYSETLRTPFKPRNTEICQAAIHLLQTHPDGHGIWIGMWTDSLRTALQTRVPRALPPQMVTKTITTRRRALLNMGIILTAETIELWDTRCDGILALDPTYPTTPLTPPLHLRTPTITPENSQPLITQYTLNHITTFPPYTGDRTPIPHKGHTILPNSHPPTTTPSGEKKKNSSNTPHNTTSSSPHPKPTSPPPTLHKEHRI
eukprot:gene61781-biopygen27569